MLDLPTEAQWEYACRAGTGSSLNNGYDATFDVRHFVDGDSSYQYWICDASMLTLGRCLYNHGHFVSGQVYYMGDGGPDWVTDVDILHGASTDLGTAEVGSYWPNSWGLYDMHGNVRELCLDFFGPQPQPGAAVVDPVGPCPSGWLGDGREARGGSYLNASLQCRSGCRFSGTDPRYGYAMIGFRVACEAQEVLP